MGSFSEVLQPHGDAPSALIGGIGVTGERSAGNALTLRFAVDAPLGAILLPERKEPMQAAGLWKTTCFEAFVRTGQSDYAEFNFSPSSQWAAYQFDGYRAGMADLWLDEVPDVTLSVTHDAVVLEARLILPEPWQEAAIVLGLSAIMDEADGTKSYWALAHPPGPPDFHHPDCFALTLAAPDGE